MTHPSSGLAHDLDLLLARRRRRQTLALLAAGGASALWGCGSGATADETSSAASATTGTTTSGTTTSGTTGSATGALADVTQCATIPEETAGPYPGDGSNASNGSIANALALTGIVRSDLRGNIAGVTAAAATGVPLTVKLRLVDTNGSCADLSHHAVYLWHCDSQGRYSMYSSGVTGLNYLRGVQVADADGLVTFQTIYPGCYDGRMPHMHFEVYRTQAAASSYTNKIKTSQLAFPNDVSAAVYASSTAYATSVSNLSRIGFATDNVFSDGVSLQLATLSGSPAAGYLATLLVGVAA